MRLKWSKLASLAQKICTPWFQLFDAFFASNGYPYKNIFNFTTAGDWDCVATEERLPALIRDFNGHPGSCGALKW